jgi:hypothetical protein
MTVEAILTTEIDPGIPEVRECLRRFMEAGAQ